MRFIRFVLVKLKINLPLCSYNVIVVMKLFNYFVFKHGSRCSLIYMYLHSVILNKICLEELCTGLLNKAET